MGKKCSNSPGGRMRSPTSDGFSFFKIMIGPFKSTMYIPPKAAGRLETLVDHNVHLEDSNGKCWKVKVSIVDNSLAFHQGWGQFVLDHDIVTGEFVVFKYNGGRKFSLQIYGLSGCERLYFPLKGGEDILKPNNPTLSNDLPSAKRRKPSVYPRTTEGGHESYDADGLTASKTSMVYEIQFLHIKNALGHDSAATNACNASEDLHNRNDDDDCTARNACNASTAKHTKSVDGGQIATTHLHSVEGRTFKSQAAKKNMVGMKISQTCHGTNIKQKKKIVNVQKESSQHAGDPRECNSIADALDNQIAACAEGVKFLVNEDGICFVIEEHPIIEPNQSLAAPISVDISAMTNENLFTNEVVSHDHEMPVDPHVVSMLNCSDNCDAAIEDPPTKHVQEGNALDTMKMDAPSDERQYTNNAPGCPKPIGGSSPNMMVTMEVVPSDENASQCLEVVPECPGTPKPIGVAVADPEVLALPEPVRYSFSVTAEVQTYQELPMPLPAKRMRIDRKVVFLRDLSQRVWPILYHESKHARFTGFVSGWSSFATANDIQVGDGCVLEMASEPDALFDVHISRERDSFK